MRRWRRSNSRHSAHFAPNADFVTVVSGLPRSGTSLMMQMLVAGGLPALTDAHRPPDANNPNGYYEYAPVKRLGQSDASWMSHARGKALKVVSPLLAHLPPGFEYRVIFMERSLEEVVQSQARMIGDKSHFDAAKAKADYAAHGEKIRAWLASQPNVVALYVAHHDALTQPDSVAARVVALLGLPLDESAMASVSDPALYRARGE